MNSERERFLNLREKPVRLVAEEVAHLFNCTPNDIPILVAHGLLKPLGRPADNTVKYFATDTVKEFFADPKWLAKATETIREHWRMKNARRSESTSEFFTSSIPAESDPRPLPRG